MRNRYSLFGLFLLIATHLQAEDNACYQASIEQRDTDALQLCKPLADAGDSRAAYFWALANINVNTQLGKKPASEDSQLLRILHLPIEEKHAIQDAKYYLEEAVVDGHIGAHFLLGYVLLNTAFSMPEFNRDVTKTSERAIELLEVAAQHDNMGAILTLAEFAVSKDRESGKVVNIHSKYLNYLQIAAKDSPDLYPNYLKTLASGRPNAFSARQSDKGMLPTFRVTLTQQWKRWGAPSGRCQMGLMLPRLFSIWHHQTFK